MFVIKETTDYQAIKDLWNKELGFIYPISDIVFQQNLLDYPNKLVYGAFVDQALVGFIVGKEYVGETMPELHDKGWISLFYVAKRYRKHGIGSSLLKRIESHFINKTDIHIGRDVYNFFPGVPCDFDNLTDLWLEKKGYVGTRYTHDLIHYQCPEYTLKNNTFAFREARLEDKEPFLSWMKLQFGSRWYYEAYDYFRKGGTGKEYVLAFDGEKIVAFCRINDGSFSQFGYGMTWHKRFTNLGGAGPLGVDKHYRGQHLGYDIVAYALNTLKQRNKTEIIIDWTGLIDFYQQFGFEVWKSFKYMSKKP